MDTPAQDQQVSAASSPQNVPPSEKPPQSHKSLLLFGVLGAVLLMIFIVGAYLLGMNNANKKPVVYNASPTAEPTVFQDLTSGWKTYTGKANDFSFKLPPSYSAQECGTDMVIIGKTPQDLECDKGVSGIGVSILDQKSAQDSIAALKRDFNIKQKTLSVHGASATQYEGKLTSSGAPLPDHAVVTVFQNGSNYVLLSYYDYDQGEQRSLYDQILSTFSFNNQTRNDYATDWITYIDKDYNFSVNYPADWKEYDHGERFFSPKSLDDSAISYDIISSGSTSLKLITDEVTAYPWQNKSISSINIDGVPATKVEGTNRGVKSVAVVFEHKGFVYQLQTLGDFADVFNHMLSTFKFTQ